jgi:hypothetical protein
MDWLSIYIILAFIFIGWLARKVWPCMFSDRTLCFRDCIYYKKKECHCYGSGHIAKNPCPEYIRLSSPKYSPEDEDD